MIAINGFRTVTGFAAVATLFAASIASTASAQTNVEALEEVVVTARKVEEKLNDVPVAISVFTSSELQKLNATSLSDIAAYTPGFSFESYAGGTTPAPLIRGLTQNALTDRNQNVATFVNGVHVQQQGNVDFSLLDLERIEIIKGPQNAQYGKSSFAGAINWVPKKPKLGKFEGSASATFGSDERRDWTASVSFPVWSDKLAVRMAAVRSKFDGTYANHFPGDLRGVPTRILGYTFAGTTGNVGGWNNEANQVSLLFRPIDAVTIDLMYYRSEGINEIGSQLSIQPRGAGTVPALGASNPLNCSPRLISGINQLYCGEMKFSPSQIAYDPRSSGNHTHSDLATAQIKYEINERMTATYIFGRGLYDATNFGPSQQSEVQQFGDRTVPETGTGRPTIQFAANPITDQTSQSQELRFDGKISVLTWRVGAYHNKVSDVGAFGLLNRRLPLSLDPANIVDARTFISPVGATNTLTNFIDTTDSYFATLTLPFAETWSVDVEGRSTREKRVQLPLNTLRPGRGTRTFTEFTPRVNLRWKPQADWTFYASAARGAKAGGFNGLTADVATFEPEKNTTLEAGAKQTLWNRKLQLNYDIFFVDWKNLQLSVPDTIPLNPGVQDPNFIGNVKGATSKGFEIEAVALLLDRLKAHATASYADSKFKGGVIDTTFGRLCETGGTAACPFLPRQAGVLPLGGSPIGGHDLPRSPKTKLSLGLEYTVPVAKLELAMRGDLAYQSKYFIENLNLAFIPKRTLLNLNVALSDPNGHWSVSLWGKNVTDEVYASSAFAISVINQYIPALGLGRTFGVTARYNFDGS